MMPITRFIGGLIAGATLLALFYALFVLANAAMPSPLTGLGMAGVLYSVLGSLRGCDHADPGTAPLVKLGPGGDYTREVRDV